MTERIKRVLRRILNSFFRGNNLLFAIAKAQLRDNALSIGNSTDLRNVKILMNGKGNSVIIGEHCSLSGLIIYMNGDNNQLIIGDCVKVNATGLAPTCFNACDGCTIKIDSNCLFSNSIEIHTTDYHKLYSDNDCYNIPQDVHIGSHTWVGLRTLIMKGVNLAPNTVVGANSVVTKSYDESNAVLAGIPAKIVKKNVEWDF